MSRKGGEEGLKKILSRKRLTYFKKKMSQHAAIALVVAAASAFQYPKFRLLAIVFGARALRFSLVGVAAFYVGRAILRFTETPEFTWYMAGFMVLCAIGSAISIVRWTRRSRCGAGNHACKPASWPAFFRKTSRHDCRLAARTGCPTYTVR